MSESSLQDLSPDKALEVLTGYVRRNLGSEAEVKNCTYREDYKVWESWVQGVEGYVKAYIVRLGATQGEWVCKHITVMDTPPIRGREQA